MRLVPLLLAAVATAAQEPSASPEMDMLQGIRTRMARYLASLPNYTCLETIQRTIQTVSGQLVMRDALRFEVAMIGGRDVFAWPGSTEFDVKDVTKLIAGGTIGSGDFGMLIRTLFGTSAPTFVYVGKEMLQGHQAVRFKYHVPLKASGYKIEVQGREVTVAFSGSVWADADTLDLLRVETHAGEIPQTIDCSSTADLLEYERARLGDSEFLLPSYAEMSMTDRKGTESRNRIQFSSCHQYTSQSSISFDQGVATTAPLNGAAPAETRIPAGQKLQLRLETPITANSTGGDALRAVLERAVRLPDGRVVPKGTAVRGRVTRVQHHYVPREYFIVGLQFTDLAFGPGRIRFSAALIGPRRNREDIAADIRAGRRENPTFGGLEILDDDARPGEGVIAIRDARLRIGVLSMTWKTS